MGIIRAAVGAVGGTLADQWLESVQPDNMGETTVMTGGVLLRANDKRNQNRKGSSDVITNGSKILVGQNQFMLLTDGGRIVDYTGEPGYYTVDNASAPSLFNGEFGQTLEDTFTRIKFGGAAPTSQKVYFINTQEIKNIAFGTVNPINYFDNFYNAELYLRCHGYFSIRILDPLKFYSEAIPRNAERVDIKDIHKLYLAEFLNALQTAIGKMSVDGIRISHVTAKGMEMAQYLSTVLDADWTQRRGMRIESVGISSISYDEESKKLINMRNQGAMLSDPTVREGYVQGSIARGMESAGSNTGGSMKGYVGMGMGMRNAGGFMASASATNQAQMQMQQQQAQQAAAAQAAVDTWTCECGGKNTGKFCGECGKGRPAPAGAWICECGAQNTGKFCGECGKPAPASTCPQCGTQLSGGVKFCPECGEKL